MANLLRLLNNVRNNKEVSKVFSSIDKKYPQTALGATTPISNQLFSPLFNEENEFSKIIFTDHAFAVLNLIREIDHSCSIKRMNTNKSPRPIKFICYGYKDFDGDIIINHIDVPIIEYMRQCKVSRNQEMEFLAHAPIPKELKIDTQSRAYDYLRTNTFSQNPIGQEIVCLFGTTKHKGMDDNNPTDNCFTMSELAEAVIPDVKVADKITSGVIAITPRIMELNKSNLNKSNPRWTFKDGSLECAVIEYEKSEQSNLVRPISIHNLTQAVGIKNGKETDLLISSSSQDTTGLYRAKNNHKSHQNIM